MKSRKVKYVYGRNDLFDYYISEEKKDANEIEIEKDSLAYKLDGPGKIKISKYCQLVYGNYDFLIEKRKQNSSDVLGYFLASIEDIEMPN
mgnify:FL=1